MAHVFQMMAGTSHCDPLNVEVKDAMTLLELVQEIKEADVLVPPPFFDAHAPASLACTCPVCGSNNLTTLAELGASFKEPDEDEELIPNVRIGVTGVVLPDQAQLARWFRVPRPPKFKKSRLHKKAQRDGKQLGTFTFFSTFSFETVFFNPTLVTMGLALTVSLIAAFRGWANINKLAVEEDKGIALELTVRKQAFRARNGAWEKLYYCSECGMVHDREGKRSLPWYAMLQLVHYPEQGLMASGAPALGTARHHKKAA